MSQKNIDFGNYPDDPDADSIRAAMVKIQDNFTQLFAPAGAESAVTSVNRTPGAGITVNGPTGNVVVSANIACVQVHTSTLSIGRGTNGSQDTSITSSSQVLWVDLPDTITTTGNIDLGGYANFGGNIYSSNANLGNLAIANYFSGDGSLLTNLGTGSFIANGSSNVAVALNGNVTIGIGGTAEVVTVASGNLFVKSVRNASSGNVLYYDATTKEITYSTSGAGDSSIISNGTSNVSVELNGNITAGYNGSANIMKITGNVVSIGYETNMTPVSDYNVAIGHSAGRTGMDQYVIAIGANAGYANSFNNAILIGESAGRANAADYVVAIGTQAGYDHANSESISIGTYAGYTNAAVNSIFLGTFAGEQGSSADAIGIGTSAGRVSLGGNSIAIGAYAASAGGSYANTITINATGAPLNPAAANSVYIKPIRNTSASNVLYYDPTSGEVTYSTFSSGASLSAVNVFTKNQSVTPVTLTPGATVAVDASLSNHFRLTVDQATVIQNPTNATDGMILNIIIRQNGTGGYAVTFGNQYSWPSNTSPTITTTANKSDVVSMLYDGSYSLWRCAINQNYS